MYQCSYDFIYFLKKQYSFPKQVIFIFRLRRQSLFVLLIHQSYCKRCHLFCSFVAHCYYFVLSNFCMILCSYLAIPICIFHLSTLLLNIYLSYLFISKSDYIGLVEELLTAVILLLKYICMKFLMFTYPSIFSIVQPSLLLWQCICTLQREVALLSDSRICQFKY